MGRLRNTYIIFTSDNGFFFGEHRLVGGKFLAYEPATHLPFLMRGPGIKPGSSTGELAMNIDIAPTILELAHATADKSVDGRSLVPYITDTSLRSPAAAALRVLRRDQRRRGQRRRTVAGRQGERQLERSHRLDHGPAKGLHRDPARRLQVHRVALGRERALRHHQRPVRAQQPRPRQELRTDPQLPPQPAARARGLLGRTCREEIAAPIPLTQAPAAQDQASERKGTARKRTGTETGPAEIDLLVRGEGRYPLLTRLLAGSPAPGRGGFRARSAKRSEGVPTLSSRRRTPLCWRLGAARAG